MMMKKPFLFFCGLILILGLVFYAKKQKSETQEVVSSGNVSQDINLFRNYVRSQSENKSIQNAGAHEDSPLPKKSSGRLTNLEEPCWEKLGSQVQENNFRDQNQADWSQIIGPWFTDKNSDDVPHESSAAGMFMQALAEADLLSGYKLSKNEDHALELLADVQELDPANSAPALYAALIESRRGNEAKAKMLLSYARSTKKFDSYMTTISRAIFSRVRTPAELIQATGIFSQVPVPDAVQLMRFLKNHDSTFFAEQMTLAALNENNILPDIDYFILDYAVGRGLLNPADKNKLPTLDELRLRKDQLNPFSYNNALAVLKGNCEISSLNSLTTDFQRYLEGIKN